MAKKDFPEKRYATVKDGWYIFGTIEDALEGRNGDLVEVAEYTLTRVVGAKMVADIRTEIG